MKHPRRHNRRSIRLAGHDYTRPGAYFVTICTDDHACLFGDIVNGKTRLNKLGRIVWHEWFKTEKVRSNVQLYDDEVVIMPNHIHGIIRIVDGGVLEAYGLRSLKATEQFGKPVPGSIPTIVRSYKSIVTRRINELRKMPGGKVWQRGYYESIVRDRESLHRIRQYIRQNPTQWDSDHNDPCF